MTCMGRRRDAAVLKIFSRKTRTLLGVDVSSSAVKLLEFAASGSGLRLENYVIRPLPANAVQEKNIQDEAAVAECLRQAVALLKPQNRECAVAVAGSAVITKTITMSAALSDAELENQIVVEADQYIPYPLSEVAIDFERQEGTTDGDNVDVLLAACRRENVDLRVAAIESAGLTANVVDIEAFAMERAYELIEPQFESAPDIVAIVDIGSTVCTLYVLRHGKTIYTREQLFGGQQLLDLIQMHFSLSPAEAEVALRQNKLPPEYEQDVLPGFRNSVVEQVSRSLQLFFSSSHYNEVQRLLLAGGVSAISGLAEAVEEATGTATSTANPFADISTGERVNRTALVNDAPALMIACGLAMRKRY